MKKLISGLIPSNKNIIRNDTGNKIEALNRSQAVIEFDATGNILEANDNFLNTLGYNFDEISGRHHKIFVPQDYADTSEYKNFWKELSDGQYKKAEHRRIKKGGEEIWIQASYNPILDKQGRVVKIVKFATDITAQKLKNVDYQGQIQAIHKSQAVIEFDLNGIIQDANENFLKAMGYKLEEIQKQHHSIFAPPGLADSAEYRQFWDRLRAGEYQAGEFKRIDKNGKEIWIQATYNPVHDLNGKPIKVIKFATDITAQKSKNVDYQGQIQAINKSQAVIEFDLNGIIQNANENFLKTMGYTLEEIQGQHHKMFAPPGLADSAEYRQFWDRLRAGEYQAGEFKRIGKNGEEIWIQATYNPILDINGHPIKVVKFATNITRQVMAKQNAGKMIESAAVGTEELSASVQEITESMTKSRAITEETYKTVEMTDQQTNKLAEAAEAMGGIVELINNIAGQINLLALNATIESARAGEAGKGFAVVANEVKNLAAQAKSATDKISEEISSMCNISLSVVESLRSIKSSIEHVREYVNATAAAVEEQSAVANEISSSMQRVTREVNNLV
jgi:methyl-accepting chemotaxis protein